MAVATAALIIIIIIIIIITRRRRRRTTTTTTTTKKINQMCYVQRTNIFGEKLRFRKILNNDLQLM